MLKQKILKLLLHFFVNLHNFSYKKISSLSIIAEGGIHPKHRLMDYHKFFIDNISEDDKVLDVGCGNGSLTYDIAKKAKKVVAVDINKNNIEIAKKKFSKDNIEYLCQNATKLKFNEEFDVVVLSNVLEHIGDRISFLINLSNISNKFLIRVPMLNRDWLTCYKKEIGCEYRLDPTHKIEYTLKSFEKELSEANLKLKKFSIQFGEIWAVVEKNL